MAFDSRSPRAASLQEGGGGDSRRQTRTRAAGARAHRPQLEAAGWLVQDRNAANLSAGRWRPYSFDGVAARDKASLDLFWLRDESLEDLANLPDPHVIAEEIAEDLRDALEQIESVLADLKARATK